ncbi:MAG: hypothetical protein WEB31_06035 [Chthoniobacterales bacterium]
MIRVLIVLATCGFAWPARAQSSGQLSAYDALKIVGAEKGDALLAGVVEIRGVDAAPQPLRWTLSFKDDTARGGVREFVVAAKGIIAERAPLRPSSGTGGVMAATGLKLNSTGAFDAANREAAAKKLGFSTLNYRLENKNGTPVWLVELFDAGGASTGSVEFSARNGTMVTPFKSVAPVAATDPAASGSSTPDPRPVGERWVSGGGLAGHMERWGTRTWEATSNTATRVSDSLGAFFTGRPARPTPAD